MLENIEVLYHSCIRIKKEKNIYVDPFGINKNFNDADLIFITHDHYDHYSEKDIAKVKKEDTIYVAPKSLYTKLLEKGINEKNIIMVMPNEEYKIDEISFKAVSAYNINKKFHPKENNWVGYVIKIDNLRYYIAGDTDITEENKKIRCDIAFVPVGGTYTMNYEEAANLVNIINPKMAVPIHYGSIVGNKQDANNFIKLLNKNINGRILMN